MKIISWNVNGINACIDKGAIARLSHENADIYCFQEMKATKEKMPALFGSYLSYHSIAERKGYSGVSTFSRKKPVGHFEGLGIEEFDKEGRAVTTEFDDLYLVNVYFPNSNHELSRLDYKLRFNAEFAKFCKNLERHKPVIVASDFNVAHTELDIARPKENEGNAGFTKEERAWFDSFIGDGFIDTFREFERRGGHYTWWSFRDGVRSKNIGWRIDYFVASKSLRGRLVSSRILSGIYGSDHCPIALELD